MRVGELAIHHATAPEVRHGCGHYRRAEPARDEAHHRLHLDRLLGDVEGHAGLRGQLRDDIVQARRDLPRNGDERLTGHFAQGELAGTGGEPMPCRQREHEPLALHDQVLEACRACHRRQKQTEVELACREGSGLVGRQHLAQREAHTGLGALVGFEQPRQHAVIGKRHEADAKPRMAGARHGAQLVHRAFELAGETPRFLEKPRALRGELHPAARTMKKRHAQVVFERADGARQRRLRDVQRLGRAAEMQPLGHRHEIP